MRAFDSISQGLDEAIAYKKGTLCAAKLHRIAVESVDDAKPDKPDTLPPDVSIAGVGEKDVATYA